MKGANLGDQLFFRPEQHQLFSLLCPNARAVEDEELPGSLSCPRPRTASLTGIGAASRQLSLSSIRAARRMGWDGMKSCVRIAFEDAQK